MTKSGLFSGGVGMANAPGASQAGQGGIDLAALLSRGQGGILPERGSRDQYEMVQQLLQSSMASAQGSGSPVLAALTPMIGGAVGTRTEGLYKEAQEGRDAAALDGILEAMGGGTQGVTPTMKVRGHGTTAPPSMEPDGGSKASAKQIREGLIRRGLPAHVAQGFVMNMDDESGLNPGINEVAPIVPGSRGGFGLSQWTGPRREALETYAAQRGMPVENVDLQLDFLMQELSGSESAAADAIMATSNSGEAAAAIVNKFLRPAEVHRARREAQYLGSDPRLAELMTASPQPSMSRDSMRALLEVMTDTEVSEPLRGVAGDLISQNAARRQGMSPKERVDFQRSVVELEKALAPPKPTAAEAEIERLVGIGVPREIAIKVQSGVFRTILDPVTREPLIVDLGTGEPVFRIGQDTGQSVPETAGPATPDVSAPGLATPGAQTSPETLNPGTEPPQQQTLVPKALPPLTNAEDGFGLEGNLKGAINAVSDFAGFGTPFEDVRNVQDFFAVFSENLTNAFAQNYGRQPTGARMDAIQALTAQAGGLQGAEGAQSKLRALKAQWQRDLETFRTASRRRLKTEDRARLDSNIERTQAVVSQIDQALSMFGAPETNTTQSGVTWRVKP